MKRFSLFLALFLAVSLFGQEKFDGKFINTNSKGANASAVRWRILSTGVDTSAIFDLHQHMGLQYCFNDTSGAEDSMAVSIVLQTSLTPQVDSTWALASTIKSSLTTCGWRPVEALDVAPAPFGRFIVTGLAANDKLLPTVGWIRVWGWSNQNEASIQMR